MIHTCQEQSNRRFVLMELEMFQMQCPKQSLDLLEQQCKIHPQLVELQLLELQLLELEWLELQLLELQ